MCLAIPAKILSIDGHNAVADFDGTTKKIVIALLPKIEVGKFVIVHAGYAIEEINEVAAKESLELWRELLEKDLIKKEDYV
ncbi:MAG: HypC/HybG/HupF family hydrogenase formation chaperone [Promethearchaeota archaeon]